MEEDAWLWPHLKGAVERKGGRLEERTKRCPTKKGVPGKWLPHLEAIMAFTSAFLKICKSGQIFLGFTG